MRKLVIALVFTSVAFASSTAYFAHQLSVERQRQSTASAHPPANPAPVATRQPLPASAAHEAVQAVGKSAQNPPPQANAFSGTTINGQPISEADIKKMQAEYSRAFLARLADPDLHEEMLAEYKMMMRNSYPLVDRVLGLSPEEYARFIQLSAQQQLDAQEMHARCMTDPACDMHSLYRNAPDARQREIDDLLGAERAQKFASYKNTMGEREAIAQLRNRLPDSQRLTDDKAEALIAALAEERDVIHREAAQSGTGMNGFNLGAGMVFSSADAGTFEERYQSAQRNSQRLRDRASQYLSAEQMRAFNEMQDETLISLRGALRNKEGMSFNAEAVAVAVPAN
jgi:hypothetical protein